MAAWALAEGNRWEPDAATTHAERTERVTSSPGSSMLSRRRPEADLILVTARAEDGVGHFLVERSRPGVVV